MSRIREQYIETGQVRFVYKHFAILGPESNRSAEASECAAEQEKFWQFHDAVFADQVSTRSTLDAERLASIAGGLGLDTTAFRECLDSGRYTSQIRQESLSVQSLGVRGTPAFLINGTFVSGAQPFDVFQQLIEEQLAKSGSADQAAPTEEPTPPTSPIEQPTAEPVGQEEDGEPVNLEDEIEGMVFFPEQSTDHHDGDIDYHEEVPVGGTHSDDWQNCGIYNEPLPEESVVHSLEHGAVWIAYQQDLPAEQIEILRNLVRQERQTRGEALVLLAPEPGLESPIIATAWQVQLTLEDASDERLPRFLNRYQNGPFAPETNAPCSGSLGEPLE